MFRLASMATVKLSILFLSRLGQRNRGVVLIRSEGGASRFHSVKYGNEGLETEDICPAGEMFYPCRLRAAKIGIDMFVNRSA